MSLTWPDSYTNQIIQCDCLEAMKDIPNGVVQCCVTSPPYWGLRDYQTAKWEGGDSECDHVANSKATKVFGNSEFNKNRPSREETKVAGYYYRDICGKCGAIQIDYQLGLEANPEEYVSKMVSVFREVRRVLKDDGVLWINLGDSYASNPAKGGSGPNGKNGYGEGSARAMRKGSSRADGIVRDESPRNRDGGPPCDLSAKNLVGIPWRVAFALQADGWWLRQDIVWHKLNPMPESVTDRCTKAHEYLFLMAKSTKYYYDAGAIREKQADSSAQRALYGWHGCTDDNSGGARTGSSLKKCETDMLALIPADGMRNKRSVWSIPMHPFKDAHFATFPPDLVIPCIKAGSRPGDIILDPFMGAGTVALVAKKTGRNFIGIELNPDYCEMALKRINGVGWQKELFE